MTIVEWINHASFRLEHGQVNLIVDPWFEGSVFNSSWSLLSPTKFAYDRFAGVSHIWLSHEHPDHFSPLTLKRIPQELRSSITVLYQWTRDKRVVDYCRKLGFACRELSPGERCKLSADIELAVGSVDSDSWLYCKAGSHSILNLNDCVFSDLRALDEILEGYGPIDVLFSQFSYAIWAGNRADATARRRAAQAKLESLLQQIEHIKPKWVVPCASFVWFSHEENVHMNDAVNRIDAVHDAIAATGAIPVVLYPGDLWQLGRSCDSRAAIEKYRSDWKATENAPLTRSKVVTLEDLHNQSRDFLARLRSRNWVWMMRPLLWLGIVRPVRILLSDVKQVVSFDIHRGLTVLSDEDADISMTTEALSFCMRFDFGFDTTMIAGRFEELRPGARFLLSRQFALARRNNDGLFLPSLLWRSSYGARKLKALLQAR